MRRSIVLLRCLMARVRIRISMTTMKHYASDWYGGYDYYCYGNEKSVVETAGSIDKNLTGCLQRYVVLQYERMIKYLILNTNNIVLQIIPSEHNFDFHRRRGEICPTNPTCLDRPACRHLVAWITCRWSNPVLAAGRVYIMNMLSMRIIDQCLILLMPVRDMDV
jgi:hypothetical protein